jgi:hypothetical protein
MSSIKKLTIEQHKAAYRYRVERCVVQFFNVDEERATNLVSEWWARLAKHRRLFRSGLFMHDEPINTAAALLQVKSRRMTKADDLVYEKIVDESLLFAQQPSAPQFFAVRSTQQKRPVSKPVPIPDENDDVVNYRQQRVVA